MTDDNDLVLETLLLVRKEIAPDLDEQLVRSCYAIQKKHQFDRERASPAQAMDRLVDQRVDAVMAATAADEGAPQ